MLEGIRIEQCSGNTQYLVTYRNEGRLIAARFATSDTVAQVASDLCAIMANRHQESSALLSRIAANTSPQ
jgi:hypothetical protein